MINKARRNKRSCSKNKTLFFLPLNILFEEYDVDNNRTHNLHDVEQINKWIKRLVKNFT